MPSLLKSKAVSILRAVSCQVPSGRVFEDELSSSDEQEHKLTMHASMIKFWILVFIIVFDFVLHYYIDTLKKCHHKQKKKFENHFEYTNPFYSI